MFGYLILSGRMAVRRHMEGQSTGAQLNARSVETTRMARDERGRASLHVGDLPPRPRVSAAALMLGSGPRFARDAFGPVLVFYVGWKLIGFPAGILAATTLAIAAYIWERRQARSGITAGIGLGIALVQATAGLASGSTTAYFAPPVLLNGA